MNIISYLCFHSIFYYKLIYWSVLDDEFAKDFGITSAEIEKVLKDFEIEEDLKDVKRWYDGNKIGNIEGIYNPWSILKYLKDRKIMNQMYGD